MIRPAELTHIADPVMRAYGVAWQRILDGQVAVAADPLKLARRRRLAEMLDRIEGEMDEIEAATSAWIRNIFPKAYGFGAAAGAADAGVDDFVWTQIHQEAVQRLATGLFHDLLGATTHVREDTKKLIRTVARDEALQKAIEGRTATQAGNEMSRILASNHISAITYRDGSTHGLAEYGQMAMRTTTATAYNEGTLAGAPEVKYFEVFDGPGCGWSTHNDGEQALGKIVTREEAQAFPISHPNCRRAFGPRPDITNKQQAKDAKRSVTEEQTKDQIATDEARRATQTRAHRQRAAKAQGKATPTQRRDARLAGRGPKPSPLPPSSTALPFEQPKKAFGPGVKHSGYATAAEVPGVTDLVDAGWAPEDAVKERKRLDQNARNVEARAKRKAKMQGQKGVVTPAGEALPKKDPIPANTLTDEKLIPTNVLGPQPLAPKHPWYRWQGFTEGEPVPVRGVTIQNYKVERGVAARINGRNYLVELKDGQTEVEAFDELKQVAAITDRTFKGVPPTMSQYQRGVAVLRNNNPADAHWAKQYNKPGFKSAATGGNGGTTFWNSTVTPQTLLHEFGHTIDSKLGANPSNWLTDVEIEPGKTWQMIGVIDKNVSEFHSGAGVQTSIRGGHKITVGTHGVTDYGGVSVREDFAESVRLYLTDRHQGYIGWSAVDGTKQSIRFRDLFPERAKALDAVFGVPVEDALTPFQSAMVARAVKLGEEGKALTSASTGLHVNVLAEVQDVVKSNLAKAAAEKLAQEAAAKVAAEAAKLPELTAADLSFADKTGIGVKKANLKRKLEKELERDIQVKGLDESTIILRKEWIKQRVLDLEEEEIAIRLSKLAAAGQGRVVVEKAIRRAEGEHRAVLPEFKPGEQRKAGGWRNKAGTEVHPKAEAHTTGAAGKLSKPSQAKANISAELGSRFDNPDDWEIFRAYANAPRVSDQLKTGYPWTSHTGGKIMEYGSYTAEQRQKILSTETSRRVQMWAGTSGDAAPPALAMQMAVKDEMGTAGEVFTRDVNTSVQQTTHELYAEVGPFYRRFVRHMYEHTQEELEKAGIDRVSLYRGMRWGNSNVPEWARDGTHRARLQPASSFSSQLSVAQRFGNRIFLGSIPRERVLGSCRTGFGCLNEAEFVILDSEGEYFVQQKY